MSKQTKTQVHTLNGFLIHLQRNFCASVFGILAIAVLLLASSGCAQLRLPAIDPTGNGLFRPGGTQLLTPGAARFNQFGQNQIAQPNNFNPVFQPQPFTLPQNIAAQPTAPIQPAFQHPQTPPPCYGSAATGRQKKKTYLPDVTGVKSPGQNGQIIMTPSRIVAPVGSEVVVLAGICGGDGFFVKNQPLEWMLSNNSVGELIEVGGQHHPKFNQLIPPTAKKFSGQYAHGRTGLKNVVLTRGTPTNVDDIELAKGQTYVSVSSASPGTSYVTAIATKAEGWDKRKASTIIHWVDGQWAVPVPSRATAGTVHPLTTVVSRTDGTGVKGWETRYSIVGGAPAEFAPTGSNTATAVTDVEGKATVQIRQPAGQFEPGTTQVRVDIVRPPVFGEPELVVESGITSVTWSAPALTLRAIGPRESEIGQPFTYRVEVTNPGDQVSRGVVVRTKSLADGLEFISSTPKPTEYGRQYEWTLGDIAPGSPPKVIDIQMKSQRLGNIETCFEVASETDGLSTEACSQTEFVEPCIGYSIQGPTTATVGDTISFNVSVENQCNDPLEDIEILINYDPGLVRPGKSNPAQYKNPILQVNESQPLPEPLTFYVQAPGTHCFNIEVRAKGVTPQFDRRCIEVQPASGTGGGGTIGGSGSAIGNSPFELTLRPSAPYDGLPTVEATIVNRGNAPIEQVALVNRTSDSITPAFISEEFVGSSNKFDDGPLLVSIGRIEPNQQVTLQLGYSVLQADPSAMSEISISSPAVSNGVTRQIRIPTEAIGIGAGGVGSGGQSGSGGQGGEGTDVPNFNNVPDGEGIGIPGGTGNSVIEPGRGQNGGTPDEGNLQVSVRTLDTNVRVGQQARMQFAVKNNSRQDFSNVDVRLLVPPGLNVVDVQSDSGVEFKSRWELDRINVLRAGEELVWTIVVVGQLDGPATVEAQAKSDATQGAATGTDSVVFTQ